MKFKSNLSYTLIFLIVFIGAVHQIIFSRVPLREVPILMSSMRAKEFCSCYFILNKGKDYCLNSVKKGYPLFEYKVDDKNQRITFTNFFAESSAQVIDKKYGCNLQ